MKKLKELYTKYKEIINYLIFGVLTTLVNIVVYAILAKVLKINYMVSNITAIGTSILFAYITNKLYVFESKNNNIKDILKEIVSFFACRGVTALMDMGLMFLTVSIMHLNDMLMKIIVNIIVILLNYIFSKLIVFKKNKESLVKK